VFNVITCAPGAFIRGSKLSLVRLCLNILLSLPLAPLKGVADSYLGVSVFLGCDAASLGIWFPTSRDSVVKSSPVTGLEWPRGFQEVKIPRFHDNGTGWW